MCWGDVWRGKWRVERSTIVARRLVGKVSETIWSISSNRLVIIQPKRLLAEFHKIFYPKFRQIWANWVKGSAKGVRCESWNQWEVSKLRLRSIMLNCWHHPAVMPTQNLAIFTPSFIGHSLSSPLRIQSSAAGCQLHSKWIGPEKRESRTNTTLSLLAQARSPY